MKTAYKLTQLTEIQNKNLKMQKFVKKLVFIEKTELLKKY